MHNLKAPVWAKWSMTQDWSPDVFWWMNEEKIQPVHDGKEREIDFITKEEFSGYMKGEYDVRVTALNISLENK